MSAWLYSYNPHSEGGKLLSRALSIRMIKHQRSAFRGSPVKTVINWGSSNITANLNDSPIINKPEVVGLVSNKKRFFEFLQDVEEDLRPRIPDWTTDTQVALGWIGEKTNVCIRSVLQGHSGEGLTIVGPNNIADFIQAPLYTRYVPKKDEYRVHIVRGQVIDYQRKALRKDFNKDEADWQIRNLMNGFVFVREDGVIPEDVLTQAIKTMNAIGLDFGAIDVLYQQNVDKAFVIEVNTAPGLMNTTLDKYAAAIKEIL